MTTELAAVVMTKNEEDHIGECLDSLAWIDHRVVFDSYSADRTIEIAQQRGAQVIQHPFQSFAAQRDAALKSVDAQWIFFVDADERATPELAEELGRVIRLEGEEARAGWWVPRHNYMIGHRMRGGGWYPDYQLRLLRRDRARYHPGRPVHEIVLLDGKAGHLKHVLLHYNYDSVSQFKAKMLRYTDFEARILQEEGARVRSWTLITMPIREFWRRFVALKGYQDHLYGALFGGLMSWYTFVTYWRLRQLKKLDGAQDER